MYQHAQQSRAQPTLLGSMCRPDAHIHLHATLGTVGLSLQQLHRHTTMTPKHVLQWHALSTLMGVMFHLGAHAVLDTVGVSQQQQALHITHLHALLLRVHQTVMARICQVAAHATQVALALYI